MNEARGVPEHITSYAKVLFDKVLENLKNNKFKGALDQRSTIINIPIKFIEDSKLVEINEIKIDINFDFYSSSDIENIIKSNPEIKTKNDDLLLTGMGMNFEVDREFTKNNNFKIDKNETPILQINFLANEDANNIEDSLYNLINDNYDEFLSSFGHEIMHHITMQAKGEDDIALRAKYIVVANSRKVTNTNTLNDFVFNLYYLTSIENIVRPSEFKTFLDSKRITKKQFLQSYYDSNMYKKFNICENIKYEDLYNNLDKDLTLMFDTKIYNDNTKNIIILAVLEETLTNMITEGGKFLKQVIKEKMPNAPLNKLVEVFVKKFDTFIRRHLFIKFSPDKSINSEKTFKAIIKDMNITAIKMKKKIAKLYEDIPYNYES